MVESADGLIYRVSDTGTVPLIRGAEVPAGVAIRTARDSHAMLRLRDGSHVEMRERSGFSVSERGSDMTIGLDHGAIIVQAAKRHAGHLYVSTRDCRVAVTGTVFSVNSGLKGSRVTVIEGTVLVAQDRHENVLHAGDQVATSSAMGATPVPLEISWSQNAPAYIAMLNAVTALNAKLDQDHFPALRFSSNLLTLVPAANRGLRQHSQPQPGAHRSAAGLRPEDPAESHPQPMVAAEQARSGDRRYEHHERLSGQ